MKKWIINYYNKRVFQEISSMPKDILASYVAIADMMESQGPNLGMPHTRAMRDGLFEIRASGKEGIGRIFYCTVKNNAIWMVHSIIKKTEQTPQTALLLARKRMKEVIKYDK